MTTEQARYRIEDIQKSYRHWRGGMMRWRKEASREVRVEYESLMNQVAVAERRPAPYRKMEVHNG